MKKIALIIGSPRKGGNTDMLAKAFAEGAKGSDNSVDIIYAADYNIQDCLGCDCCKRGVKNKCALKDDMEGIYTRLAQADVFVFATPVYFYGLSGKLKCLVDRLHNPIRNDFKVKKLALLAVCADDIRENVFDSLIAMYRANAKYFDLEDGGIITVSNVEAKGDIAGNSALERARALGREI